MCKCVGTELSVITKDSRICESLFRLGCFLHDGINVSILFLEIQQWRFLVIEVVHI